MDAEGRIPTMSRKNIVMLDCSVVDTENYFGEDVTEWETACDRLNLRLARGILNIYSHKDYDNILYVHTPIKPLSIISKISKNKSGIYGPQRLLNSDIYHERIKMKGLWDKFLNFNNYICPISELLNNWGQIRHRLFPEPPAYFIRPTSCRKQFTGGSFTIVESGKKEFLNILRENNVDHRLKVQISPSVRIAKEWRFVIINEKIVDYSLYKDDGIPCSEHERDFTAEMAVNSIITEWAPAHAYTMDVARLFDGRTMVIEYNALSTSGLYDCSKYEILKALKELP